MYPTILIKIMVYYLKPSVLDADALLENLVFSHQVHDELLLLSEQLAPVLVY